REDLASVAGEEVECQDAIGADDTVGLIEPEAECVSAGDDCAVAEGESHHERGEASTDSAETPGGFGDGDRAVVERRPGAGVDLDACLIPIPQPMDLQPERA